MTQKMMAAFDSDNLEAEDTQDFYQLLAIKGGKLAHASTVIL
jgi:hypothetical protein